MIRMLENDDDIYLDSYLLAILRQQPVDPGFDPYVYDQMRQLIIPEIENRLVDLLIGLSNCKPASKAEELFSRGYAFERGLFCKQDCHAAYHDYLEAAQLGLNEANFRLGWLTENSLAPDEDHSTAIHYYRLAADAGNRKALVALAQRYFLYFCDRRNYTDSLELFGQAENLNWPYAACYKSSIRKFVQSTNRSRKWLAKELECLIPLVGNQPKGQALIYTEDIESDIRLAKFCHQHGVESASFFVSWCHMVGLGLPRNPKKGLEIALSFSDSNYAYYRYYLAWVLLCSNAVDNLTLAMKHIAYAAESGLSSARQDLNTINSYSSAETKLLFHVLMLEHIELEIEKCFDKIEVGLPI